MRSLGVASGTPKSAAVFAAMGDLTRAETLPATGDVRSRFAPGHAHVRRVPKQNLWIWYRFDDEHLDVLAMRNEPPVPDDES